MGLFLHFVCALFAVCCQMPLLHDVRLAPDSHPSQTGTTVIVASFALGVLLLTLSVWSAAWLVLAFAT